MGRRGRSKKTRCVWLVPAQFGAPRWYQSIAKWEHAVPLKKLWCSLSRMFKHRPIGPYWSARKREASSRPCLTLQLLRSARFSLRLCGFTTEYNRLSLLRAEKNTFTPNLDATFLSPCEVWWKHGMTQTFFFFFTCYLRDGPALTFWLICRMLAKRLCLEILNLWSFESASWSRCSFCECTT